MSLSISKDDNAIVVQVLHFGMWHSLGYIPAKKINKVASAMENNEIVSLSVDFIFRQFIFDLGQFRLFIKVCITKLGKWNKDNKKYMYNM